MYEILANSLSWISNRDFKKGEKVKAETWTKEVRDSLEKRGFIKKVEETVKAEPKKAVEKAKAK